PLVVALHGCFQTPEDFAAGTRLNAAAERRGLLVLYPAQRPRDNASRCWNWFEREHQERTSGEVAEILALVAEVGREHPVVPGRVVVLGISAGGFMAVNLVCAAPDVVSGVGVVAAGPYRCGLGAAGALACMRGLNLDGAASAAACLAASGKTTLAVRASLWHGALDTLVAPTNLAVLQTMFARLTGTTAGLTERREGAVHALYRDAQGRPALETWPSRSAPRGGAGGSSRSPRPASWAAWPTGSRSPRSSGGRSGCRSPTPGSSPPTGSSWPSASARWWAAASSRGSTWRRRSRAWTSPGSSHAPPSV